MSVVVPVPPLGAGPAQSSVGPVGWRPTARLGAYTAIVLAGLVGALVAGRGAAVALVAPFAVLVAAGLASTRPLGLMVEADVVDRSVTEGDEVEVVVDVQAGADLSGLDVVVTPTRAFLFSSKERGPGKASSAPGTVWGAQVVVKLTAGSWGSHDVGTVHVRAQSWLGLLQAEADVALAQQVKVYPHPEALRRLVQPRDAVLPAGAHLARAKGPGIEPAGVRAYAQGDRAKDVNWKASARHTGLFTNERHPDRGADVILVLDTFGTSVLDRAVRAASSLVRAYLAQRDRVGLVKLGGYLQWIRPGTGNRQEYLVVDALLGTSLAASDIYRGADLLPPKMLPPRASIIALSSLQHGKATAALVDLHQRGLDVVALEVVPPAVPSPGLGQLGTTALELWDMGREMGRENLRAAGVPVVEWAIGVPLAQVVEEVDAWSRGRPGSLR